MREFEFQAAIGKKIAKALDSKGIEYSLVADHSSIRNQTPTAYPGNFGNDVTVTMRVHLEDVELVEKIRADHSPNHQEAEVPPPFRWSESNLVRKLKKVIRRFRS